MNPTLEKESDIEAFSGKLLTLTMEANRELIKCNELRDYLDANAELLEKTYHTRAYAVARSLCNLIAGAGLTEGFHGFGSAEIIHREYKNVLAGLLEGDSNFMIRLLAERAALCWLHVQAAENDHRKVHDRERRLHRDTEWAEKCLTAAQNRFLRACAALTKARAMITATEIMRERQPAKPRLALVAGQ